MVENKIVRIIYSHLKKFVTIDDVQFYPSNDAIKYVLAIGDDHLEINYFVMDSFYRIKLENIRNNQIQGVLFLTKSKRFKKDIRLVLKKLDLSRKTFDNHMKGFSLYLSEILDKYGKLDCLAETYVSDTKFDGIFV